MKKMLGIILSLALAIALTPAPAGAEQWQPFQNRQTGSSTVALIDSNAAMNARSRITAYPRVGGQDPTLTIECKIVGMAPCENPTQMNADYYFVADIVLPLCESDAQNYCVRAVNIYESGGPLKPALYKGQSSSSNVSETAKFGVPKSASALLYQAAGVTHKGGADTYLVSAVANLGFDVPQQKFTYQGFAIVVLPYTNGQGAQLNQPFPTGEDFAPNTRVGVTVNLPSEANGWFSGRLKDPLISMKAISASVNELKIDGESLLVPRLEANVPADKFTSLMTDLKMTVGMGAGIESGFDTGVSWVDQLRPFVQDKAVGETNVWNVRASPAWGSPCFTKNKFNGIVTTNAVGYSWNPPKLAGATLDYKVGGLHFSADGSIAQGTYDLVLDSKVARCLYGFSTAPISATVSVTSSESGVKNVATTLVSEKNGWLKLSAYGFHYSSPIIRVAITQKGVVKRTTVTCVSRKNAKITKRVTAVAPKCPTGYKKK